jgi:hypothetical protein
VCFSIGKQQGAVTIRPAAISPHSPWNSRALLFFQPVKLIYPLVFVEGIKKRIFPNLILETHSSNIPAVGEVSRIPPICRNRSIQ